MGVEKYSDSPHRPPNTAHGLSSIRWIDDDAGPTTAPARAVDHLVDDLQERQHRQDGRHGAGDAGRVDRDRSERPGTGCEVVRVRAECDVGDRIVLPAGSLETSAQGFRCPEQCWLYAASTGSSSAPRTTLTSSQSPSCDWKKVPTGVAGSRSGLS